MSIEADKTVAACSAKDKHNEASRRYYAKHKEKMAADRVARSEKNKAYQKEWYLKNQAKLLAKQRVYYAENKDAVCAYQAEYQKKNREAVTVRTRKWHKARMEADPQYREYRSKVVTDWFKRKRKTDPVFRAVQNLRNRLRTIVVKCGISKGASTIKLIGCSRDELRTHFESLFEPWMSWDNYGFGEGKWVCDHIKPVCLFDMGDPAEQRLAFHYLNLQPLCWRKNMEKSDSFSG